MDSDDSLYEDYDDDENDEKYANSKYQQPAQPKLPNEDVETIIKAGNIVPKPLPHPTPDACPLPTPLVIEDLRLLDFFQESNVS